MKTPLALLSAALFLAPSAWAQNEIGFIEKFALAQDREAVLSQLLPGSEDSYFFHALHYQNTAQAAKLADTMDQWSKRFPNSARRRIIENRSALLAYNADPQTTLKFLRDRLNLQFNHQQQVRDQKPDLPTKLDPARISRAVFQKEALQVVDDLSQVSEGLLADLIREKVALKPSQVRDLLKRIQRPDVPGLVDLIAADLKSKESKGFGEFEIHRALLPEQLDALAKQIPALFENQNFVYARLRKLLPGADADVEFDPAERETWLDRAWAYAKNLSPSFNTLKAHILYQRLQYDRTRGVYDKARFQEYLKLPRRAIYVNPEYLRAAEENSRVVDLNANLSAALGTAMPIRSDDELVRDYLLRLLKDEPSWEPWAVWLRDTWLKPVFAESKIVNGIGKPEDWASLLTPTAFQALKDRVDVDFSLANAPFLKPADDVSIDLYLKNTPKVIVKIYEINTLSYFLTNQRQLNTDLALDGLVANREVTHDFGADEAGRSPFRRTARTFKFPELKGKRGAWVIEFIGGGKSSRALVRKGQWTVLQRTGPAGEMLTVLDESRQVVKDAVVWLDGRKFTPDEKTGYIPVPFTQQPRTKNIVLADPAGEFASLATIEHHAEQYRLDAQIHIDREQLLARREATIAIRAALLLNDAQVSLDLLRDPRLTITTEALDGVSTTSEVKVTGLSSAKLFLHKISVPDRIVKVEVTLAGEVEKVSQGGAKETLSAPGWFAINGIDRTMQVRASFLSRFGDGYVYELLGKNGEPVPDTQVVFRFHHRDFARQITIALRTDDRGRVDLGALEGIAGLHAEVPGRRNEDWDLKKADRTWPELMHARAGEVVTLPWTDDAPPARVSLLEMRGSTFAADRSAAVAVKPASLVLTGLTPGDYSLSVPTRGPVTIRVTAGEVVKNWLVSPNRELELRGTAPVNIESIVREPAALVVTLANPGPFTRVHVSAERFVPERNLWRGLGWFERREPGAATPDKLPNLFAAGRAIGDEYRYILERRYSKLFPGNMLSRPGLILNPWEVRSTDLQAQELAAMQRAAGTAGARPGARTAPKPATPEIPQSFGAESSANEAPNLDFLAQAAPVLFNLVPDEKGVVRVDLKLLGDRQYIQIYAEDPTSAAWRTLALPEVPTKFQETRLVRNLDPQKPFAEKKEATLLATGQTLTLADVLTADLETYDSLAGVYSLFSTLSHDQKLAKFEWVVRWPSLKDEEKRAKYSEFACHELSFFLSRKDPAFFDKVIKPYLRNKKDRTFIDDFLLGNDLRGYLEPWAFGRLNMAERALLAQRIPNESPSTARHLRELWELVPPNPDQEDNFFETALRGRGLQEEKAEGGFKQQKRFREAEALAAADAKALGLPAPAAAAAPAPAMPPATTAARGLNMAEAGKGADKNANGLLRMDAAPAEEKRKELAEAQSTKKDQLNKASELALLTDFAGGESDRQRALVRQFFRALGPTKEWAENNYYQLRITEQNAGLVPINAFWRDYAAWDGKSPFMSSNVTEASRNFAEMMLALAVLDLPFESPKHTSKSEGNQYSLTAAGPLIAYHKQIKPAAVVPGNPALLVSQNFFRADDRYRQEGNEKFDKYVTTEFLSGVVYGANIVVTNPSSAPQKLTVLLQIPRGALPVNNSKATDSRRLRVQPYTTQTLEYYFYFPAPNAAQEDRFPHYPVQVARDEQIVGGAKPFEFRVVKQLSEIDKTSWEYLSQYGTDAEVFAFLDKTNLAQLNLEKIAWRARKSADFFRKLIALMETHHIYSEPIYRYAVLHNAAAPLATWLRQRDDFIHQCGPYLDSKLVKIDPIERRIYEQLEYSPLVNQRTHRVGAENRIPNPVLRGQYQSLLNILAHKATLEAIDQMSVTYYLFLQDRIEEGLARFHTIAPAALPTRLQHDYFRAYTAFYEENPGVARGLVQQYADYPVDRWRKVFAEVGTQLDEIEGKADPRPNDKQPDREKQQGELANTEPSFDFKVENRQIAITWKNLKSVTVNYYLMDPEFLFSASPFVTQDSGRFSIIKPTRTIETPLPAGQDALSIPLPGEFAKSNVLVEILGAGQRKAQAYHANTLKLILAENYGQLEVRDEAAGKPVSKTYVKVYARLRNGTVRYYKDGYTDLRGKFDYASLNSSEGPIVPLSASAQRAAANAAGLGYQMLTPSEINDVDRLAILLMSEAHGAAVREVAPPNQ